MSCAYGACFCGTELPVLRNFGGAGLPTDYVAVVRSSLPQSVERDHDNGSGASAGYITQLRLVVLREGRGGTLQDAGGKGNNRTVTL